MQLDEQKKEDVVKFLKEFKHIATSGSGLYLVPRPENNQALVDLGLTKKNCIDELIGLSVTDHCAGPEPDRDRPGHVWVFGKRIAGQEVYIKLKLASVGSKKIAKCISFHVAQHPLRYPLR